MKNSENSATVKMWLAEPLPGDVRRAIDRLSHTDDARQIAIMPDVHLASEVCVGTVLATSRLIYPSAVGGDIGCGMAALAFDAGVDVLRSAAAAAQVLEGLPRVTPVMRHPRRESPPKLSKDVEAAPLKGTVINPTPSLDAGSEVIRRTGSFAERTRLFGVPQNRRCEESPRHGENSLHDEKQQHEKVDLMHAPLSHPRLESIRRRDGIVQLGTLGRGNHFLEFQADEEDRLWLMVHSGSRAMGPSIRDLHLENAAKSATGLAYLDSQSPAGKAYLADADWARRYAKENRRAMIVTTVLLMQRLFAIEAVEESYFDCDHNHVVRESAGGEELWIHRKGAASAREGHPGIIPGSMGSESYHVEGRGCKTALNSSSHGAGRSMSRADTHRNLNLRDVSRELSGIWYDPRLGNALVEESPSAYKDIRQVMRAQRELTRIRRILRPVLCYRGGS